MRKVNVLILTDHSNHSTENSVYAFANALRKNPLVSQIDIATRGGIENHSFFQELSSDSVWVNAVEQEFNYETYASTFNHALRLRKASAYDLIWLRLPPPLSRSFLYFMKDLSAKCVVINDPKGIYLTGSKAFLLNFKDLCPPMRICSSIEEITDFKANFPIVLKPFREYGGKGILKIDGNEVWLGTQKMTYESFKDKFLEDKIDYLAVRYLKNVAHGDKRIVVVDGKVMGSSLRLPSNNSWLCNTSMGGTSHETEVTDEEYHIVDTINPVLAELGIVMYGIDTLEDDDGFRVLSEINTTSIGGLMQIGNLRGLPLIEEATDIILKYAVKKRV